MKVILDSASQLGLLHAVDVGFARTMCELDDAGNDTLLLLAALLSHAAAKGDVCLDLGANLQERLVPEGSSEPVVSVPGITQMLEVLRASSVTGQPGEHAPMILDEHNRLYLGRYWWYEKQVAEALLIRASHRPQAPADNPALQQAFHRLFPVHDETDWQAVAAALALQGKLSVISGGPGTGKTHTVTAILALLQIQASGRPLQIRLAAPTGKAAARLTEAIRQARRQLDCDDTIKQLIPDEASTLHRLIGIRPGQPPRFNRENPLSADVVVVDEASMIDLPLMARLLAALPDDATLVLLGDKDQLASVEAGSVFADITGSFAGQSYGPATLEYLEKLTGKKPEVQVGQEGFSDCVALLRKSWRFQQNSGIGALAAAANAGDIEGALSILDGSRGEVFLKKVAVEAVARQLQPFVEQYVAAVLDAASVEDALGLLSRFRILCALRRGPFGVEQINRTVESLLLRSAKINSRSDFYQGRPVMIARNDHTLGLFNGDVGIAWPDTADGSMKVWFRHADGTIRGVVPSRLPVHETTWAMTVHKSQGSEFDQVLLVLPDEVSPVLTRELLYTGITRARQSVDIWSPGSVLAHCVATRLQRASGLGDKIHADTGK